MCDGGSTEEISLSVSIEESGKVRWFVKGQRSRTDML